MVSFLFPGFGNVLVSVIIFFPKAKSYIELQIASYPYFHIFALVHHLLQVF